MKAQALAWLLVLLGGLQAQEFEWGADPNDEWGVFPILGQDETAWQVRVVTQAPPEMFYGNDWVTVDPSANPPVIRFTTPSCGGSNSKTIEVPMFRLVFSTTDAERSKAAPDSKGNPLAITETNGKGIAFNHEYWDSAFNNAHYFQGLSLAGAHYVIIHELAHVAFEQMVDGDPDASACQDCIGSPEADGSPPLAHGAPCSEAYAYSISSAYLCGQANATDSTGAHVLDATRREEFQAKANHADSQCETASAECSARASVCSCSLAQPCPQTDGCPGPCVLQ